MRQDTKELLTDALCTVGVLASAIIVCGSATIAVVWIGKAVLG